MGETARSDEEKTDTAHLSKVFEPYPYEITSSEEQIYECRLDTDWIYRLDISDILLLKCMPLQGLSPSNKCELQSEY